MGQGQMGAWGCPGDTPSLGCSTSQGCSLFPLLFTSNCPKCYICCHDNILPIFR